MVSIGGSVGLLYTNPALSWNMNETENDIGFIEVDQHLIWKPMILIANGAKDFREILDLPFLLVKANGEVTISTNKMIQFTCNLNLW